MNAYRGMGEGKDEKCIANCRRGEEPVLSPRSNAQERIFVAIRVRPLNQKEKSRRDVSEWECVNGNTIKPKNTTDIYTFDRVFGDGSSTEQVYEEGIRDVALSVVSGINSSIFAYGQTSSGKTYTMTGITEYAVRDIYNYIQMQTERQFVLKFSAMEIYNEAVKDLLSSDCTPLRLLDDPEKGTIVEKLTEERLEDWSHLEELLSLCAAERTTEETSMNETSSRSHQILRLTVESSPNNYIGTGNSETLVASVYFVDLAGSERASQTLSAGARLREGGHINRSLLTLGTVIRKLSKGRNGHVPYRDSKLTRILQNSLGGNARTAIICTISPASSHVEQSRNTLLFAGCAKQVTTDAHVNIVMSDKILVKQLQNELARLENELRSIAPKTVLLKERELQIEQMDKEIKELTRQRDVFQSHVENLLQSGRDQLVRVNKDSASELSVINDNLCPDKHLRTESISENPNRPRAIISFSLEQPENSEDHFLLDGDAPKFVGPDPCGGWEEIASKADAESKESCKKVRCIEKEEVKTDHKTDVDSSIPTFKEGEAKSPTRIAQIVDAASSSRKEDNGLTVVTSDNCQSALQQKIQYLQRPIASKADAESKDSCKKVRCIETEEVKTDHKTDVDSSIPAFEEREGKSHTRLVQIGDAESSSAKEDNGWIVVNSDNCQSDLQKKIQDLQRTTDHLLVISDKSHGPSESRISHSGSLQVASRSCRPVISSTFPSQFDDQDHKALSPSRFSKLDQKAASPPYLDQPELDNTLPPQVENLELIAVTFPPKVKENYPLSLVRLQDKPRAKRRMSSRKSSQIHSIASTELDSFMDSDTDDTTSVLNFVVNMNERAKPLQSKKDFDAFTASARTAGNNGRVNRLKGISFHGTPSALHASKFEKQQRDILELWDAYNVPLVHRSYFFLLMRGEVSDSVYLDLELRRLSFLKDTFSGGAKIMEEGSQNLTPNWSLKALNRERKMLSRRLHKKFSRREREDLYRMWHIDLKTKYRSEQLAWRLWMNTKDIDHARKSAALVAKLVGFTEKFEAPQPTKTFGFNFFSRLKSKKSRNWQDTLSTLM